MILQAVNDILVNTASHEYANNDTKKKTSGLLDININIGTYGFDSIVASTQNQKIHPLQEIEPAIDVFESKDDIRIIINLPKMKKDDVTFEIHEGFVRILIDGNGQIYRREIPCDIKSDKVTTTSNYNNSVLELVLKKT